MIPNEHWTILQQPYEVTYQHEMILSLSKIKLQFIIKKTEFQIQMLFIFNLEYINFLFYSEWQLASKGESGNSASDNIEWILDWAVTVWSEAPAAVMDDCQIQSRIINLISFDLSLPTLVFMVFISIHSTVFGVDICMADENLWKGLDWSSEIFLIICTILTQLHLRKRRPPVDIRHPRL